MLNYLDIKLERHTLKIIYSFFITSAYLFLTLIQDNVFFSFFITLNIFYFSRELLFTTLFTDEKELVSEKEPVRGQTLFKSEREMLPENIKKILQNSLESDFKDDYLALSEQPFIDALQKAERLIEEKVAYLQSKTSLKKNEMEETQKELKKEVIKELPEIETKEEEVWENWNPLALNEKLLNQEIYCAKCKTLQKINQMNYEIESKNDYLEVVTIHEKETEQHVNRTRLTKESYEILSKPILTVKALPPIIPAQEVKV